MWHAIVKSPSLSASDVDSCVFERLCSFQELVSLADTGESSTAEFDSSAVCVALSSATNEAEKNAALPRLSDVAEVDVEFSHESQSSAVSRLI